MDRLGLALAAARADHEVVRVADHRPQVQLDDVERLAIGGVLRDRALRALRGSSDSGYPAYRRWRVDIAHDRVGNVVPDRLPRRGRGGAAPSRRRRSSASGRTGLARRPARPLSASSTSARDVPRRSATASVASDSTRSGSRHFGRPAAMSPPTIRNSSLSGSRECSNSRVSTVYDGPSRSDLDIGHVEPVILAHGGPAQLEPVVGTRLVFDALVRWYPCGDQRHSIEFELKVRLLSADEVTKMWRIERPAQNADAHPGSALRTAQVRAAGQRPDPFTLERGRNPRPGT